MYRTDSITLGKAVNFTNPVDRIARYVLQIHRPYLPNEISRTAKINARTPSGK